MRRYLPRLLVIGLLSVFALPRPCAACSCVAFTPDEKIARADVIFRGRVTAVSPDANASSLYTRGGVTFQVEMSWKGSVPPEIAVSTDGFWGQCGIRFARGEEYLVYAKEGGSGGLTLESCRGTRSVRESGDYLRADLQALGPGTAVAAPAPVGFGTGSGTARWLSIVGAVVAIAAVAGLALRSRLGRRKAH